jgi:hypothetical protein
MSWTFRGRHAQSGLYEAHGPRGEVVRGQGVFDLIPGVGDRVDVIPGTIPQIVGRMSLQGQDSIGLDSSLSFHIGLILYESNPPPSQPITFKVFSSMEGAWSATVGPPEPEWLWTSGSVVAESVTGVGAVQDATSYFLGPKGVNFCMRYRRQLLSSSPITALGTNARDELVLITKKGQTKKVYDTRIWTQPYIDTPNYSVSASIFAYSQTAGWWGLTGTGGADDNTTSEAADTYSESISLLEESTLGTATGINFRPPYLPGLFDPDDASGRSSAIFSSTSIKGYGFTNGEANPRIYLPQGEQELSGTFQQGSVLEGSNRHRALWVGDRFYLGGLTWAGSPLAIPRDQDIEVFAELTESRREDSGELVPTGNVERTRKVFVNIPSGWSLRYTIGYF